MRWRIDTLIPIVNSTRISLILLLLTMSSIALGEIQVLSASPTQLSGISGSTGHEITISYDQIPRTEQTNGIGISVFFDSQKLAFRSLTELFDENMTRITRVPDSLVDDTRNLDDDPLTDVRAVIAYTSFSGNWPGDDTELPLDLFKVTFDTVGSDRIGASSINVAVVSGSAGWTAENVSVVMNILADTDGDSVSDDQEAADGTDPLDPHSCTSCFDFDIDIDDETNALTDGLLVLRHLFGFSGTTLVNGAVTLSAARTGSAAISDYLDTHATQLDIDGDGRIDALTDGLLLLRYLFGFQGYSLIEDARGSDATRDTSTEITAYIRSRIDTGSNVTTNSFSRVQNLVFTPSCASVNCHKGSSSQYGLDLSSGTAYSNLVNVPSGQVPTLNLVTRGNPNQSYLVQKIEGTADIGDQMPLNGQPLNTDLQQLLRNWIAEGARNN